MNWYVIIPIKSRNVLRAVNGLKSKVLRYDNSPPHITLRFVHKIQPSSPFLRLRALKALNEAVQKVCESHEKFHLQLGELGAFPRDKSLGVTWLGLENCNELYALREDIDRAVQSLGYPPADYDFNPHITISFDDNHAELLETPKAFKFEVNKLHICTSKADYVPVKIIELGG